ncbi:MAG: coniferyl aldehyde dehydrogenase [Candidatus Dadabacteria bacterium]|nr:MAG: coniferyl aldehyde dehydrogenase [Candidatus Dadabacteria bacterium]
MNVAESDLRERTDELAEIERLESLLATQREAFLRDPAPSYEQRMENLARLKRMIVDHQQDIVDAVCADFEGGHSRHEAVFAEIFTSVNNLKYTMKRLRSWMRPQRRHVDLTLQPAKAKVLFQPKGVVGIISPWNYPAYLAFAPLTAALAAGNRAILKPSEITPHTSEAMKQLLAQIFDEELVAVVTGGPRVGEAFSKLPWDHLFFTGSTSLGRLIMKNAADNLVPVTLELGGKSPTIIHRDYPVAKAAKRIVSGKYLNGGQTCVAPDYLFVHRDRVQEMVDALREEVARAYPRIFDNPDYTGIVNERHFNRLQSYLEDARDKGAEIIEINPAGETPPPDTRKIAPTILLNVNDDMRVMQDEIFGPLLPILPYDSLEDAIAFVNRRPRPLALYYFDDDAYRAERVLERTVSGNACINETVMHVATDDLPFGGIGESGLGAYHGREGFETFSHKKGILVKGRFNSANFIGPPYDAKMDRILKLLVR